MLEPDGAELFYGHRTTASGGTLVLANRTCQLGDVGAELACWPSGGAAEGRYRVAVGLWSSCGAAESTSVTIVVESCGETATWTETLHPGDANGGGACCASGACIPGCALEIPVDVLPGCVAVGCATDADCTDANPCTFAATT